MSDYGSWVADCSIRKMEQSSLTAISHSVSVILSLCINDEMHPELCSI